MRAQSFTIFLLSLLLIGCGGGSSSSTDSSNSPPPPPPPNAKPGGYYTGTVSQGGENFFVEGLITEDGDAVMISQYGIYVAELAVDEDNFSNSFTAYAFPGVTWDGTNTLLTGNMSGTIVERNSIQANFTLGGEPGTASMSYEEEVYEAGASTSRITGDWGYTITSTGYTINITFSSNGTFFGQDTDGCTYQGSWSIPNSSFNAYEFSDTNINCGYGDSPWKGIALIYFDSGFDADVMLFGIHNALYAYADGLIKN